ncbi:helix-turn-helix transcriptional regulator [Actinomadura sp. HBU206391]|uniref:helix-turn-helix transcriptional regulator n=1 Tax=Actinomadura sp. HBU206391 TaxID=2731692 RepID=UPI001650CC8F|nr:helix-turn-helix transcriptional regulator [Actinomadura sp. HBU206391]MBC6457235.1 helix-turn-helix domain-containing protein [Actinomadura sp. HBU206391]
MDCDKLLGEFLRAKREAISPDDVGLLHFGHRRTPGLRREEVAMLAGVSTDYYMRLEQGRERHPSEQVVSALARVLHLDSDSTAYMHELAHPGPRQRRTTGRVERVSPGLLRLMDNWTRTPALVLGARLDVLARNPLGSALYEGLHHNDNLMRLTFLNPKAREFFQDWDMVAINKAAHLRAAAGTGLDDPYLPELVDELSVGSAEFRRLWARQDVRSKTRASHSFRHHQVGDLTLAYESFSINGAPGQQLIVYQAEPGSTSEQALALLGGAVIEHASPEHAHHLTF